MVEVKWIKIVTDVFDDEKILLIESMPEADSIIVIWFKLLCLAGKNNNKGVFTLNERIPYTDEMLASIFRRPLNVIRLSLKTFEYYGMVEIINGVITIPNWSKHQNLDQIDAKREYQRKYMAKKREEQKLLASGESNCETNSESNVSTIEIDKEIDKDKEDRLIDNNILRKIEQAYFIAFNRQISPSYLNKILDILKKGDYGDLIIHAIELTKKRQGQQGKVKGFNYTLAILESWINLGYTSPQEIKEIQEVKNDSEKSNLKMFDYTGTTR